MNDKITIRRLDDMHCHFRTGSLLKEVLPFTAQYASRGIAMPNTRPRAILTGDDVVWYRDEIKHALDEMPNRYPFEPLMTVEVRDSTTPQMIVEAYRAGAVAGKVYPLGVTTNSDEGLRDFDSEKISETFLAIQDVGMLLLIHGELDRERTLVTKREEVFLPTFLKLAEKFPNLKIVLEHVSTRIAVESVRQLGRNVAATSGDPKFFLGSDTAPHPRERKECAKGACGVYTAPVLPQVLAEVFEKAGCLDRLENFVSRFGAEFYGLPLNDGTITLTKTEWVVPEQFGSVVPFRAGAKLQWQLA